MRWDSSGNKSKKREQKTLCWNADKEHIFKLWKCHDIQFFSMKKELSLKKNDDTMLLMFGPECSTDQKYTIEKCVVLVQKK